MAVVAGSIGTEDFVSFRSGVDQTTGMEIETFQRHNVDGVAAKEKGLHGEVTVIRTGVDVDDAAAAKAKVLAYKDIQGTIVSVVDSAVTWTNMLVLRVRLARQPQALKMAVGGLSTSGRFWIEAIWEVIPAELNP